MSPVGYDPKSAVGAAIAYLLDVIGVLPKVAP